MRSAKRLKHFSWCDFLALPNTHPKWEIAVVAQTGRQKRTLAAYYSGWYFAQRGRWERLKNACPATG